MLELTNQKLENAEGVVAKGRLAPPLRAC